MFRSLRVRIALSHALVLMVILTTLFTPPLLKVAFARKARLQREMGADPEEPTPMISA